MRERCRLRMSAQLLDVQRAKRSAAREALEAARRNEEVAKEEERSAVARVQAAQAAWMDLLSSPGFAPEYSRALAERLIDDDARAAEAAVRTYVAADLRAGRQRDWQELEAHVRASERALQRLERRVGRKDEEKRLALLSDSITSASVRR